MNYKIEKYQTRKIEFQELVSIQNWNIKVYSITNKNKFNKELIFDYVLKKLPKWITTANQSYLPTYKVGFLIIHEAREGFLVVFNWWTGGEMIESKVCFSDFKSPEDINVYPYHPKSLLCVWELEIFAHERQAWINHVLLQHKNPDFNNYLLSVL